MTIFPWLVLFWKMRASSFAKKLEQRKRLEEEQKKRLLQRKKRRRAKKAEAQEADFVQRKARREQRKKLDFVQRKKHVVPKLEEDLNDDYLADDNWKWDNRNVEEMKRIIWPNLSLQNQSPSQKIWKNPFWWLRFVLQSKIIAPSVQFQSNGTIGNIQIWCRIGKLVLVTYGAEVCTGSRRLSWFWCGRVGKRLFIIDDVPVEWNIIIRNVGQTILSFKVAYVGAWFCTTWILRDEYGNANGVATGGRARGGADISMQMEDSISMHSVLVWTGPFVGTAGFLILFGTSNQ